MNLAPWAFAPCGKGTELNLTCVVIRHLSSFANASGPAVTASRAETRQRRLLHGSSYRRGRCLVFKVSDSITSFQHWICHACRGGESKVECHILVRIFQLVHQVCQAPLSWPEGQIIPYKADSHTSFLPHLLLFYSFGWYLRWRRALNHPGRERSCSVCSGSAPSVKGPAVIATLWMPATCKLLYTLIVVLIVQHLDRLHFQSNHTLVRQGSVCDELGL